MPLLTCKDLCLGYEGNIVVSNLCFSVNAGDYLCIVGENGSGKTTLMKTILKLKAPISGQIETEQGLSQNEIGYLPQQTEVQKDFPASVLEVVRSGCLNRCGLRPFYSKGEKKLAAENMEKLGISQIAKKSYRDLSGGQQQRVLLARALCAARKIILLDEPVAGLDPKAASEMYELITQLNEGGVTVIMISHDVACSIRHASHVLHIGSQTALFFGTKADYQKSEAGRAYAEN